MYYYISAFVALRLKEAWKYKFDNQASGRLRVAIFVACSLTWNICSINLLQEGETEREVTPPPAAPESIVPSSASVPAPIPTLVNPIDKITEEKVSDV